MIKKIFERDRLVHIKIFIPSITNNQCSVIIRVFNLS